VSDHRGHIEDAGLIAVTMLGALVGGLLFEALNQLLSRMGAHARHRSLLKKHLVNEKRSRAERLIRILSANQVLRVLKETEIVRLARLVAPRRFEPGDVIFREGEPAEAVYFIVSGRVRVDAREGGNKGPVAVLGAGDLLGEMALVSNSPRTATAAAQTGVDVLLLPRAAFDGLLSVSSELRSAVAELVSNRSADLVNRHIVDEQVAAEWAVRRRARLRAIAFHTSDEEIEQEAIRHGGGHGGGSALAIWLGIALDGIPESLVIGMLVAAAAAAGTPMSIAFIIGVFLANLPEAMSSGVTMRTGGMSVVRIMVMWSSLFVLTAVGGFIGTIVFPAHPTGVLEYMVFGLEGLAAGAMLTMIAETMLPEAFEQGGGTIAGLSTLVGFIAALSVKLLH